MSTTSLQEKLKRFQSQRNAQAATTAAAAPSIQPATPATARPTTPAPSPQAQSAGTSSALERMRAALAQRKAAGTAATIQKSIESLPLAAAPTRNDIQPAAPQAMQPTTPAAMLPSLLESPTVPDAPTAPIQLNEQQQAAVNMATSGQPFCLIGSAGTGKTFAEKNIVKVLAENIRKELHIPAESFQPSEYIVVCAFTRRAVRNTYKALADLGPAYTACCKTAHKALDYKPVKVEVLDEETFEWKGSMRYMPHVTHESPNTKVRIIIVDEASMLGYQILYRELREGFPNANFVFIGDLNQLRPVMDDPTLAYALACLPVIELNHVYRQALDSPIIDFQYKFTLAGRVPTKADLTHYNEQGKGLRFHELTWGKMQDTSKYCRMLVRQLIEPSLRAGTYNPEDCIILIPYNKHGTFGATDLNLEIAELLGKERGATVHEVICGFNKFYYAPGDRVLHEKKECIIEDIAVNARYSGMIFQQASPDLNRFGFYRSDSAGVHAADLFKAKPGGLSIDEILATEMEMDEGAVQAASHHITVRDCETGETSILTQAKEVRELEFSYALTIHKSQGSEWRKVYLVAHACHRNLSREMLYTGMTRAREELVVLYSKGLSSGNSLSASSLARAIGRQEIPGKTWKEKALVYKAKLSNGDLDAEIDMDDFPPRPAATGFRVCN